MHKSNAGNVEAATLHRNHKSTHNHNSYPHPETLNSMACKRHTAEDIEEAYNPNETWKIVAQSIFIKMQGFANYWHFAVVMDEAQEQQRNWNSVDKPVATVSCVAPGELPPGSWVCGDPNGQFVVLLWTRQSQKTNAACGHATGCAQSRIQHLCTPKRPHSRRTVEH